MLIITLFGFSITRNVIYFFFRFYLGLALAQAEECGKRREEATGYISEGLEYMLSHVQEEEKHEFAASNTIKLSNIPCLQAFLILADLGKYGITRLGLLVFGGNP